ncbi:hypothetical protein C8J57DRAFT_1338914 [Mycena rebaudengoi]|nr:hypothetical protein C8J57DRAFT_1338914 [Mycena rebaudengoi]
MYIPPLAKPLLLANYIVSVIIVVVALYAHLYATRLSGLLCRAFLILGLINIRLSYRKAMQAEHGVYDFDLRKTIFIWSALLVEWGFFVVRPDTLYGDDGLEWASCLKQLLLTLFIVPWVLILVGLSSVCRMLLHRHTIIITQQI